MLKPLHIFEGFQHKLETVAVALELEDSYKMVDFAAVIASLKSAVKSMAGESESTRDIQLQ